jgi:hypothetical protein
VGTSQEQQPASGTDGSNPGVNDDVKAIRCSG